MFTDVKYTQTDPLKLQIINQCFQTLYFSGAFVLPFLVMLVLVGMPLMLLELGLGQKLRVGAAGAWKKVGKKGEMNVCIILTFGDSRFIPASLGWAMAQVSLPRLWGAITTSSLHGDYVGKVQLLLILH